MIEERLLGAAPRPAEGGAWLEEAELVSELRRSPSYRSAAPWLAPAALALLLFVWVVSYFGIPAALLDLAVLGLLLGHFWPTIVASESARHWAPRERYVRFKIGEEGIEVTSAHRHETCTFSEVTSVNASRSGWLVRFSNAPPLWLSRGAFSTDDAELVEAHLGRLPTEEPGSLRTALFALLLTASLSGTALWYWAVR